MNFLLCFVVILLLPFTASSSLEVVTFMLYDNGSSENGVRVSLTPEEFASFHDYKNDHPGESFAIEMSQTYLNVSKFGQEPGTVLATHAYRDDGEQIIKFEQLQPVVSGTLLRRVYLVAEGLQFVWPFVALGHNQTVSPNALPPIIDNLPVVLESISDKPRVFKVHNMFTEEESEALILNALNLTGENGLQRSTVGTRDESDGTKKKVARSDSTRTSENAWDHRSPAAKATISRSFNLTRIVENAGQIDGLQIVRYKPGQGYNTHPDYLARPNIKEFNFFPYSGGSNRWATVFMYLNDVEEGGYTVFPKALDNDNNPSVDPLAVPPQYALDMFRKNSWEYRLTQECFAKLAIPPKVGTAALFYSVTPDGQTDPLSMHGACPVIRGLKWGANIWIWNKQRYGDIKTGEPRKLTMTNTMMDKTVYITWEGRPNSQLTPGRSVDIGTFEFHRFKAKFGSFTSQEAFAEFTVQGEPENQTWLIEPPRDYHTNHDQPTDDPEKEEL